MRIQNIGFGQGLIYVREAKGGKDRVMVFPLSVRDDMQLQVEFVKKIHDEDLALGFLAMLISLKHYHENIQTRQVEYRWQLCSSLKSEVSILALKCSADIICLNLVFNNQ